MPCHHLKVAGEPPNNRTEVALRRRRVFPGPKERRNPAANTNHLATDAAMDPTERESRRRAGIGQPGGRTEEAKAVRHRPATGPRLSYAGQYGKIEA